METKINYYDIILCGYYTLQPVARGFGTVDEVFQDYDRWVNQARPLVGDTRTFNPPVHGTDPPVFTFASHRHQTGASTIALWHKYESDDGQIAAITSNDAPGEAEVSVSNYPEGAIPGFPLYFWVIPEENLVATVRILGERRRGAKGFSMYFDGFLRRFASWASLSHQPDDVFHKQIVGYAAPPAAPTHDHKPHFLLRPRRLLGNIATLRARVSSVTRILLKTKLSPDVRQTRGFVKRLLESVGLPRNHALDPDHVFSTSIPTTITLQEFDSIVARWRENETDFDDIGFEFSGDSSPQWLSSFKPRFEIDLDLEMNHNVAVLPSLATQLHAHRQQIIHAAG